MATRTMTSTDHDQTVKDGIVLIDFWAAWCGPAASSLRSTSGCRSRNEDIVFAKVDTEAEPELAQMYGITSIPTLVVYRDRIPVFGQPGALPSPPWRTSSARSAISTWTSCASSTRSSSRRTSRASTPTDLGPVGAADRPAT